MESSRYPRQVVLDFCPQSVPDFQALPGIGDVAIPVFEVEPRSLSEIERQDLRGCCTCEAPNYWAPNRNPLEACISTKRESLRTSCNQRETDDKLRIQH